MFLVGTPALIELKINRLSNYLILIDKLIRLVGTTALGKLDRNEKGSELVVTHRFHLLDRIEILIHLDL